VFDAVQLMVYTRQCHSVEYISKALELASNKLIVYKLLKAVM